jgi:hypothetical protein
MEHDSSEAERGSDARPAEVRFRPEPIRTQPIRNWLGIFETGDEPASDGVRAEHDAAAAEAPDAGNGQPGSARQGVAAGYRVIDEYLRQGRRAARDFWSAAQPPKANDESAEAAGPSRGGATPQAPDLSRLGERWLRSLGEFGANWLELMQAVSKPAPRPQAPEDDDLSAGPFHVGRTAPSAEGATKHRAATSNATKAASKIVVAVSAPRPVEVYVSLDQEATSAELRVGPLGDASGDLPVIRGVKVGVTVDPLTLERRIRLEAKLDAEQPSGTYHGVVLAAGSSEPVGTLTLHLS